jgi:hypothetical protein
VLWKIRIKYGYVVAQPIVHRTGASVVNVLLPTPPF